MTRQISDQPARLPYQLLVSGRARRMSLKVEPGRGLVVTVPKRFPRQDIQPFVEQHRVWIETTLDRIEREIPERFRQWPPQTLQLPAIGLVLDLSYQSQLARIPPEAALESGNIGSRKPVVLQSDPADRRLVATELTAILKRLARQYLSVRLAMLAKEQGIRYRQVQIRGQRTRWGSCSTSGTISLNYKLLFLSHSLVDYVLMHELAHTLHMDHSPAFWRQLQLMCKDAREQDARLRQAGREVPPWLDTA